MWILDPIALRYRLVLTVALQVLFPRPGRTPRLLLLPTFISVITPYNSPRCVSTRTPYQRGLPAAELPSHMWRRRTLICWYCLLANRGARVCVECREALWGRLGEEDIFQQCPSTWVNKKGISEIYGIPRYNNSGIAEQLSGYQG